MKDLHFNRIKKRGENKYIKEFQGFNRHGDYEYTGFIKCKLVHHKFYSLVIPDQLYLNFAGTIYWIQPLYFSGNRILKFDGFGTCQVDIDISHGPCLRVEFRDDELISILRDGSLFYKCKLRGPKMLIKYTTGKAQLIDNKPYIQLYHHTSSLSKLYIIKSNEYRSSNWNIQGTKESKNISYLYLTSLPRVTCRADLTEIAMASNGELYFRLDQNNSVIPDLTMQVYRESTENRAATLPAWIESSFLATQPCYRHEASIGGVGYHEVVCPFIHRIGVEHNTNIKIVGNYLKPVAPKLLNYIVVGNAASITGLKAPFDEEDTQEKLKIEFLNNDEEIISYWMKHNNSDLYSDKIVEETKFN